MDVPRLGGLLHFLLDQITSQNLGRSVLKLQIRTLVARRLPKFGSVSLDLLPISSRYVGRHETRSWLDQVTIDVNIQ